MKRLFVGLISLAVSGMSYASVFNTPGTFNYKGEWKHKAGKFGTWDAVTSYEKISNEPETLKITSTLNIHEGQSVQTMSYELIFVETGDGFFDVKKADSVVGSGYCYGIQCHYSVFEKGAGITEETMSFVDGKIYALGSMFTHEQGKTAWKGVGEQAAAQ